LKDFSHLITGIPTRVRASASAIPTVKPGKS
jgi:hypothetical protein